MSKINLNETNSGYNLQKINDNFKKIEKEFNEKVLYRNNPVREPNEMQNDLDMNGKRIYNLPTPREDHEAARLKDVQDAVVGNVSANLIQFGPTDDISSTNVQGAIEETFYYGGKKLREDLRAVGEDKGSSLVSFQQRGERTRIRTALSKMRDIVDLRDYDGFSEDPNVDNTEVIQRAINQNYGGILHIPSHLRIRTSQLFIEKGISLVSGSRFSGGSFTERPGLVFHDVPMGQGAITIVGGPNDSASGINIEGFNFFGQNSFSGLRFDSNVTNPVTDGSFRDLLFLNFGVSLDTQFGWCHTFDNIRFQGGVDGLRIGNQSNNFLFSRCSVVSMSGVGVSHTNAEMVEYLSCEFANWTKTDGPPLTLFQSHVTMTSPYIENIDNEIFAQVGTLGEVELSSLYILNPLKLNRDINTGGRQSVIIEGGIRDNPRIYQDGLRPSGYLRSIDNDQPYGGRSKIMTVYRGGDNFNAVPYDGSNITRTVFRGFTRLSNSGSGGIAIGSESLTVGDVYTLQLAFTLEAGASLIMRNGSDSAYIEPELYKGRPKIVSIAFKAKSPNIQLIISGGVNFYGLLLEEGNSGEDHSGLILFPPESRDAFVGQANAAPTSGTWQAGDIIWKTSPDSEIVGYVCTAPGSPGTWRSF